MSQTPESVGIEQAFSSRGGITAAIALMLTFFLGVALGGAGIYVFHLSRMTDLREKMEKVQAGYQEQLADSNDVIASLESETELLRNGEYAAWEQLYSASNQLALAHQKFRAVMAPHWEALQDIEQATKKMRTGLEHLIVYQEQEAEIKEKPILAPPGK